MTRPPASPCRHAPGDEDAGGRREADHGAEDREGSDPDQEHALATPVVAEPATDDRHDAEGERVAGDHPLQLRRARAGVAPDRGQRDGHDADVEQGREQRGDAHRERPPAARVELWPRSGGRRGHSLAAPGHGRQGSSAGPRASARLRGVHTSRATSSAQPHDSARPRRRGRSSGRARGRRPRRSGGARASTRRLARRCAPGAGTTRTPTSVAPLSAGTSSPARSSRRGPSRESGLGSTRPVAGAFQGDDVAVRHEASGVRSHHHGSRPGFAARATWVRTGRRAGHPAKARAARRWRRRRRPARAVPAAPCGSACRRRRGGGPQPGQVAAGVGERELGTENPAGRPGAGADSGSRRTASPNRPAQAGTAGAAVEEVTGVVRMPALAPSPAASTPRARRAWRLPSRVRARSRTSGQPQAGPGGGRGLERQVTGEHVDGDAALGEADGARQPDDPGADDGHALSHAPIMPTHGPFRSPARPKVRPPSREGSAPVSARAIIAGDSCNPVPEVHCQRTGGSARSPSHAHLTTSARSQKSRCSEVSWPRSAS